MDRFDAMSLLLATVDHGSLSAAGRALRVPLPTVSRKITELEKTLGTRLLIRGTRKLSLTDAGLAYVAAARRILEQVAEAEREASGEFTAPKGELVLSAPLMFGRLHVLPVVTKFLATYPEINVTLLLSDRNLQLADDHVDMAVRIGTLPDSAMVATRVGSMRTVVCASPALLRAHGNPRRPGDLHKLPCISVDSPLPARTWRFMSKGTRQPLDVDIAPRLAVTSTEAAVDAAVHGVGVTRQLHYQVAGAIAQKKLMIVLARYEIESIPIHLVHAGRGQMPLKMRRFLDFAAPLLRRSHARSHSPVATQHA